MITSARMLNSNGGMIFSTHIIRSTDLYGLHSWEIDSLMKSAAEEGDDTPAVLLLEGGSDIDPSIYGEPNRYSYVSGHSMRRDETERRYIDLALENNVPIFGICRGHQLLAAHMGGTLWQDLQQDGMGGHEGRHLVYLENDLLNWAGSETHAVNSLHHQAVRNLPKGSVQLAMYRGVNEALWYPQIRAVSVQWHPELASDIHLLKWALSMFGLEESAPEEGWSGI